MGREQRWPGDVGPMLGADIPGFDPKSPGHSGRLFVIGAVIGVLLLWGSLNLAFRQWRDAYRERAARGVARIRIGLEPFEAIVPADEVVPALRGAAVVGIASPLTATGSQSVSPASWRAAVEQTRAMLETLVGSNVLDSAQMDELAARIAAKASETSPATVRADLTSLWDEAEDRAGPIVQTRHPRPEILPAFRPKHYRWVKTQ